MSYEYDRYLTEHIRNVRAAFFWIHSNLPEIIENYSEARAYIIDHDRSKYEAEEYDAYDKYFYGGSRSYAVVRNFNLAWLHHIHTNPHHWQHWVLINDDSDIGIQALDIPNSFIIEMICDWWSFSWTKGNLFEIFEWYDSHKNYMMLSEKTRRFVESYLEKIKSKLNEDDTLQHHGIKGQKWGVKNGPPYPLDKSGESDTIVKDAIESGEVSKIINSEKQRRHTKTDHTPGRSYLDGDLTYAQELVDKHSGKGEAVVNSNNQWTGKEKFSDSEVIGTHVDMNGTETKTNKGMIVYSKTGTHVYPRKEK